MNKRDFKGVWIPANIWLDDKLSPFDKVILLEIDSLDNEKGCWKSNKSFADFMQCGLATVTRSIKKLESVGYIKTTMSKSDYGTIRVIKMIKGVSSKRLDPPNQNDYQGNTIKKSNKDKTIIKEIELPRFVDRELWNDFMEIRIQKKAVQSDRAMKMLINDLDKFERSAPGSANKAIEESIKNSWKGLFAPKKGPFNYKDLPSREIQGNLLYLDYANCVIYDSTGKRSYDYDLSPGGGISA